MIDTLTQEEQEKIVMALVNGQETFTEDDAIQVLDWASEAMLEKTLLEMVLMGKLFISVRNGIIYYHHFP